MSREDDALNAARGLVLGSVVGALLWIAGVAAGVQLRGALQSRDARTCALESYGTDRDIARCYLARGLQAPQNFDAKGE